MAPREPGTSQHTHQEAKVFAIHGATSDFLFQDLALPSDARTDPDSDQIPGSPVAAEVSCIAIGRPALDPGYPGRHVCRVLSVGSHCAVGVIPQLHRHISAFPKDSAGLYWQTCESYKAGRSSWFSPGRKPLGRCCFTGRNEFKEMPISCPFRTKGKSSISVEYLRRVSTTTPRRC